METIADLYQLPSGDLLLRPRSGRKLEMASHAKTTLQSDGSFVLASDEKWVETGEAMRFLRVPWSTLRRLMDSGAVRSYKRSPSRWAVSLASLHIYKSEMRRLAPQHKGLARAEAKTGGLSRTY